MLPFLVFLFFFVFLLFYNIYFLQFLLVLIDLSGLFAVKLVSLLLEHVLANALMDVQGFLQELPPAAFGTLEKLIPVGVQKLLGTFLLGTSGLLILFETPFGVIVHKIELVLL